MSPVIAERAFEDAIECGLLRDGPDSCAGDATAIAEPPGGYGDALPGGYHRRGPEEYDRTLCLLPRDVIDFLLATQPKEWQKLGASRCRRPGAGPPPCSSEIERRGALDVLRNGLGGVRQRGDFDALIAQLGLGTTAMSIRRKRIDALRPEVAGHVANPWAQTTWEVAEWYLRR